MKPIDFDYSFAPPHRLTVCLPDSSVKLLCDAETDSFSLGWSFRSVREVKRDGLFEPLKANERVKFTATVNGGSAAGESWGRDGGILPIMRYTFAKDGVYITARVAAGKTADIIKVTFENRSDKAAGARISGRSTSLFNRLWIDPADGINALIGNINIPPDAVAFYSPDRCAPSEIFAIEAACELAAGQSAVRWIVRPYDALLDDADKLAATDWEAEFEYGKKVWDDLLARSAAATLPDAALQSAYYACLADMFVMREAQKSGHIVSLCGSELYRCTNPCEPLAACRLLAKLGYTAEAKDGMHFSLSSVEPDGDWNEPRAWPHESFLPTGCKCLAVMEYYRLTGDIEFLRENCGRMVAAVRHNEQKRRTTLNDPDPARRGLLPRGMGDGGLGDNGDMYGVFYPHNFYSCYAAKAAAQAARLLGRDGEAAEMERTYADYLACLKNSLALGAMSEPDGSRWIGGCPGNDGGSRWSAVDCVYPCGLTDENDPLVIGTLAKINRDVSEGGLPLNMGWIKGGLWVAVAVDNISVVSLLRGERQRVMDYLYAAINHATPFISWCEERTPERNAAKRTGDLQHQWTPLAICNSVTNSLLFSGEDGLYVGWGYDEQWRGSYGIRDCLTHWGRASFSGELSENEITITVGLEKLPPRLLLRGSGIVSLEGAKACESAHGLLCVEPTDKTVKVRVKK